MSPGRWIQTPIRLKPHPQKVKVALELFEIPMSSSDAAADHIGGVQSIKVLAENQAEALRQAQALVSWRWDIDQ